MNIEAQLEALCEGNTVLFFNVYAPSSISFLTLGMSADSIV